MLRHARDGGPGHCSELATTTARWRPRSSVGMAWQGEEGSSARGSGSREVSGVSRGAVGEAGGGLRPSSVASSAALRRRAEKQRGREEEEGGWTGL